MVGIWKVDYCLAPSLLINKIQPMKVDEKLFFSALTTKQTRTSIGTWRVAQIGLATTPTFFEPAESFTVMVPRNVISIAASRPEIRLLLSLAAPAGEPPDKAVL
jgi:hypothetical protein